MNHLVEEFSFPETAWPVGPTFHASPRGAPLREAAGPALRPAATPGDQLRGAVGGDLPRHPTGGAIRERGLPRRAAGESRNGPGGAAGGRGVDAAGHAGGW